MHFKGHLSSLFPSVLATANVYLAKVKLDPEWFLLVLQGIYTSPALTLVTFPAGLAVTGATLSSTSAGRKTPGKRGSPEWGLGKDMHPQYCLAICFTSFWLKGRETSLGCVFCQAPSQVMPASAHGHTCNSQITQEGGCRVALVGSLSEGEAA